ncbi:LysM repeat protein [Rhodococcus sp. OAS809]|uniref:LysM peptidoglycan-binding domain-containing protein n=1 Tax=Rhodococcus sp. OAS809 TaxID=2663874 RepID=UPI00178A1217
MGLPNPITTVGAGLENIGKGLGGAVTTTNDWMGDRAKDVVRGDAFGIGRRENEELRRNFEETLNNSKATLAEVRDQLGKGVGSGETDGVEAVHGREAGKGALSKDLDASYTVGDGDTLSKIAEEKGKSLDDLLGMNPELGDGNLIRPGQEIKLGEFKAQESPTEQIQTPTVTTPEPGTEMQV